MVPENAKAHSVVLEKTLLDLEIMTPARICLGLRLGLGLAAAARSRKEMVLDQASINYLFMWQRCLAT